MRTNILRTGLVAVALALVSASTAQATTWMVNFDRLNGVNNATADTYVPGAGYDPSVDVPAAAAAIDATGMWNEFNPDTRGGDVLNGGSGIYGGNRFNGVNYYGDANGVELFDVTGGTSVKWKLASGSADTSMWLPRYQWDTANGNFGKLIGLSNDYNAIGGNDGARDYTIELNGLTAGNSFKAFMFGWAGSNADTVNLNLNAGEDTASWTNAGVFSTRGGLVEGTVPLSGIVTLRVTDTLGWFSTGMVFSQAEAAAVPEPSTFVLAGLGLLGLGCVALRKKFRRA